MDNESKSPEPVEGHYKIQGLRHYKRNMYYVYILRGPQNHLYVGVTENINQRIERHKNGDGAEFTKRNKTFELVYQETFPTLIEARRRESQIKGWRREKKENLIKFGKPIIKS